MTTKQELKDQIATLRKQLNEIERQEARQRSRDWVKGMGATLDQVEMSSGDGKPYFFHISAFADWCKLNSKKRFLEWNRRVYIASEVIYSARLNHAMSCDIDDVPQKGQP